MQTVLLVVNGLSVGTLVWLHEFCCLDRQRPCCGPDRKSYGISPTKPESFSVELDHFNFCVRHNKMQVPHSAP